jgi:predicted TIM-barrel fold metal-dependent hydrolase
MQIVYPARSKNAEERESKPLRGAWTRRAFCKAFGLSGLTWAFPAYPLATPQQWPSCVGPGPAPHQRIDAHVHIFNGTDLQIAGFLKHSVANEYPDLKGLLYLIADPLQDFVWTFSPKARDELTKLNQIAGKSGTRGFSEQDFGPALETDRAETQAQYNEFLRQQFRNEKVRQELIKMIRPAKKKGSESQRTIQELEKTPPKGTERELARRVDELSGIPVFDYLEPYFELVQVFTCANTSSVDTFVALLVDFDQPLGEHPGATTPSTIDDQTAVTSRICELSRGHLVALAPYCPFKDVARKNASLKNVLQAWKRPGFVGAKLYPPMSFYPYGNGKDGNPLDAAIGCFYHECVNSDAVVMAHAGPSMCRTSPHCKYPGPTGWARAVAHVFDTEDKPLRAALGHFGGPFENTSEARIWPEEFLDLMTKPSGQKLYADLSYASEVLQASNDSVVVSRLAGLIKHSSTLTERLMYGSDWLMLGLEPQWQAYAKRMEAVIDETEKKSGATGFKARFFGGNARDWLGLDQSTSLGSRNTAGL